MDIAQFNSAFATARHEQRTDPAFDLAAAQDRMRALIADEPEGEDRAWAERMITKLTEPLPPAPKLSALYDEAAALQADLPSPDASPEERYAALAEAQRQIWAIADRAGPDEEVHIRALTAPLQQLMDYIHPPTFGSGS